MFITFGTLGYCNNGVSVYDFNFGTSYDNMIQQLEENKINGVIEHKIVKGDYNMIVCLSKYSHIYLGFTPISEVLFAIEKSYVGPNIGKFLIQKNIKMEKPDFINSTINEYYWNRKDHMFSISFDDEFSRIGLTSHKYNEIRLYEMKSNEDKN